MNPFKRVSPYTLVFVYLGICILFSGCGNPQQWEAERIASNSRLPSVPRPGTGSGSVRGVLKNIETGTPVKNATVGLFKVKSTDGGKVRIEVSISSEGKMLGGMTTETDGDGTFRFEDVEKGTPYWLGAVDNTGKNVIVLLSTDDTVKDLGIVYQKKQSGTQKVGEDAPSVSATPGGPKESDIVSGLTMVSMEQYTMAIAQLELGLTWLNSDPSYRATSDSLVSKEAEYISKLIEQIRSANQEGVFGSSNPMAIVIETANEASPRQAAGYPSALAVSPQNRRSCCV